MTKNKQLDELCYPFIHEQGYLCDFEVITDELCTQVGMCLALLGDSHPDLLADLGRLQHLCWHVNGSIRGRLAIVEDDMNWLHDRYDHYREEIDGMRQGFVLPQGSALAMQLQLARSSTKKAIRALVRLQEEDLKAPEILSRFCNLLCNFFFILAGVVNHRDGFQEPPFTSKSYGQK